MTLKTQQRFQIFISLLLTLVTIASCHEKQKFDKAKWIEVGDLMTFPNRNSMVDDFVKNYDLKGKALSDVTRLLGQPQYPLGSTMEMGYKIDEKYGSDIDPIYTKTLLVKFDRDTLVKNVEIKEWKK